MRKIYVKNDYYGFSIGKLGFQPGDAMFGDYGGQQAMLFHVEGGTFNFHFNVAISAPSYMTVEPSTRDGFAYRTRIVGGSGVRLTDVIDYVRGTTNDSEHIAFLPYADSSFTLLEPTLPPRFIMDKYTQTKIYTGQQSYHSHPYRDMNVPVEDFKGHRIGIELEVEANSSAVRRDIVEAESNWFCMETDASLGSNGIEFVTIPLLPKDAKSPKTWTPLVDYLSGKAKSWSTGRCGLHVHIGREILGNTAEEQSETIGKMLYLYHHGLKDNSVNVSIYGRQRAYHDQNGAVESARSAKSLGPAVFKVKDVKDKVKGDLISQSSSGRYFDINISPSSTIEFRKGRGSINVNRICAIVEYSELIALYARKAKWETISVEDFFAWACKRVKRTSPLSRWISQDEVCA
jgi:hypothetical protein